MHNPSETPVHYALSLVHSNYHVWDGGVSSFSIC